MTNWEIEVCLAIFTACKRSCGKVMFLHLSIIRATGGLPSHNAMRQADTPSVGRTPPPAHNAHPLPPQKATPPPPPRYGESAGCTHPTGLHICLWLFFEAFCRWYGMYPEALLQWGWYQFSNFSITLSLCWHFPLLEGMAYPPRMGEKGSMYECYEMITSDHFNP